MSRLGKLALAFLTAVNVVLLPASFSTSRHSTPPENLFQAFTGWMIPLSPFAIGFAWLKVSELSLRTRRRVLAGSGLLLLIYSLLVVFLNRDLGMGGFVISLFWAVFLFFWATLEVTWRLSARGKWLASITIFVSALAISYLRNR